jgi:hypothetical protein
MTKGIQITELTIGTGDEATKESIVVANVRQFLRRGDEVGPSPIFGTKMLIDMGRRDCIAGLRYGILGMRVGGTREIIVSPHLAYGKIGIPGTIPPNALLRCEVELLELREHRGLLPRDWQPGKVLTLRRCQDPTDQYSCWGFEIHEGGNSRLSFGQANPGQRQKTWVQVPIPLNAEESAELIRQAMDLPKQMPEECVDWDSGFIDQQKNGTVIRDKRGGARCMVVHIMESGKNVRLFGVHEESAKLLDSPFYKTIDRLIRPHFSKGPA